MLAIVEAYRSGFLKKQFWLSNLIAGLIVGVVALPLAMAFAIASGVKPEQGLYTAIIAGICVSVFGGSRVQIAGPTGAFVVILAGITAKYGVEGLQLTTLLAGIILLIMGIVKLGSVIKFIPDPVIVGFTSGIGVIIFVGEWKDFFGLNVQLAIDASFVQKITALFKTLPTFNVTTTVLACLSLLLVIITPRLIKRIPGPLVAMLVVTLLQSIFHFNHVATLGSAFGGISQHLPFFHIPDSHGIAFVALLGPAFTIASLGAIESLLSAAAADGMVGTRHNSNQELIGQGIANVIAPLFGGFAATGAIARTATNIRNGGNSPLAGIIHSVFLILVILILAPLAFNIPLCALAAILFVVAFNMSDVPHFIRMLQHAPWYDVFILFTTFILTVFTNLIIAVNVGVILSLLFFIGQMVQSVKIEQKKIEALPADINPKELKFFQDNVLVYSIQGPFFFGVAEKIEHALAVTHTLPKIIIIRLKEVPFIDMTGLETFHELINAFHQRGVKVFLSEANAKVIEKLQRAEILNLVEQRKVFDSVQAIVPFLYSA